MPHEYRINKNKKRRERRLVNISYKSRKQIMKKEVTKELPSKSFIRETEKQARQVYRELLWGFN